MPQASDELRTEMECLFGDPVDDGPPMRFLEAAGYTLKRDWNWTRKPGVQTYEDMTQDEWMCMVFLRDEWDMRMLEPK